MSANNSEQAKPIYKYFRGKWKELGVDNKDNIPIEEKEHCINNLEKKSVIELEELIFRQEKLLSNKTFISKLKDKGRKLQQKLEELQNVLKVVEENHKKASEEKKDFPDIYSIEWNVDINENNESNILKNSGHNIDDDDSNPLQLLARHSVDYPEKIHTRKFRDEDENASELIVKELEKLNIEDAKAVELDDVDDSTRNKSSTNYFTKKCINLESSRPNSHKERFRPNRSLKEYVKSSEISVKSIPIAESLKLIAEAHNKEREKVYSEAAGALQQSTRIGMTLPASNNLNYRDTNTTQHLLEEYEEEDISDFMYSRFSEEEEDKNEY